MELERENEKVVIPTVGMVLLNDSRILLVRHKDTAGHMNGVYGLPAVRLKPGESEKEAAVRELRESVGLATNEENLLGYPGNLYTSEIAKKEGGLKLFTIKVLICKKWKGILISSPGKEVEWIPTGKLYKYNLLPNILRIVHDALKFLGSI